MKSNFASVLLLIVFGLCSCLDDTIPSGLYRDQVVRLLTNDSSKVWTSSESLMVDCSQPDQWIFTSQNDSVIYRSIATSCLDDAIRDTAELGIFQPSFLATGFTDSLLFADESFWIVEFISSQEFTYIDPVSEEVIALIPVE